MFITKVVGLGVVLLASFSAFAFEECTRECSSLYQRDFVNARFQPPYNSYFVDVRYTDVWDYTRVLASKKVLFREVFFRPRDSATRLETLTILIRSLFAVNSSWETSSSSVSTCAYADAGKNADILRIAFANGLINCQTNFRPNDLISRQEFAKIVSIAIEKSRVSHVGASTVPFSDLSKVDETLKKFVVDLQSKFIISGYPDPGKNPQTYSFQPLNNVSRGEVAKIVARSFFPDEGFIGYSSQGDLTIFNTAEPPSSQEGNIISGCSSPAKSGTTKLILVSSPSCRELELLAVHMKHGRALIAMQSVFIVDQINNLEKVRDRVDDVAEKLGVLASATGVLTGAIERKAVDVALDVAFDSFDNILTFVNNKDKEMFVAQGISSTLFSSFKEVIKGTVASANPNPYAATLGLAPKAAGILNNFYASYKLSDLAEESYNSLVVDIFLTNVYKCGYRRECLIREFDVSLPVDWNVYTEDGVLLKAIGNKNQIFPSEYDENRALELARMVDGYVQTIQSKLGS